jgi:hypothetical protein
MTEGNLEEQRAKLVRWRRANRCPRGDSDVLDAGLMAQARAVLALGSKTLLAQPLASTGQLKMVSGD